ncbi:F-box/LRR-repeat protein 7-like isoform X2 [Halichondria panicea]|uniref:F-box/LRR-repeat protein 7-like isoform X2 n=1 Tax=Halichondria panicea TaxID=6063 RepID=UPI00312BB981
MVKSLEDYCLACIARHITTFNRLGNHLSLRHKEVLLERMCWHQQLTPEVTPSIFYNLFSHTLLRVNLSYSPQVTDRTLELLGNSGCLPTSITLNDCPNVTDRGISCLTRILRKTEVLKLKRLHQITSKGLKSIVSRSLKYINLSESNGISDEGIIDLVHNCPNIEKLSVFELHKLSDVSLTQVAAILGGTLTEIDASDINLVTSQSTQALAEHCRNLTVAKFESCVRLDGSGLIQMAERCDLTDLWISFCYKISQPNIDIIVSLLRAKERMVTFNAMGIGMSTLSMQMIAASCLTSLSLCGVTALTDSTVDMITKATGHSLVNLDVSNCLWLTNRTPAAIARHCHALEKLGLRNMKELNGRELCPLFLDKRAKNFKSITLSGSKNDCAIGRVCVKHTIPNAPIGLLMGKDLDTGQYTRVDNVEFDSLKSKLA